MARSGRVPECCKAIRARLLRDSAHSGWRCFFAVPAAPAYSFVSPGCCKRRMWRQLSSQVAKAQIAKTTAQRSAPSGIAAPLPKSQSQATPTPSSSDLSMLGMHAASRKSGSPALHEADTLLGAGAVASDSPSIQLVLSHQKQRAFQPTPRPRRGSSSGHAQTRTLVGGGVRKGCGDGDNRRCTGVRRIRRERHPEPIFQVQRILRTRHECPGVSTAAHEKRVRVNWMTSPGSRGAGSGTQRNTFSSAATSEHYEGLSWWLRESSTSWRSSAGTL